MRHTEKQEREKISNKISHPEEGLKKCAYGKYEGCQIRDFLYDNIN
jgi:hypothetical protein